MMSRLRRDERGFTIVEGLVVLVVTGILITLMFKFHLMQNKEYDIQTQISFLQKDIRSSMESLGAEIRMAGSGFPKTALPVAVTIIEGETQTEGPPSDEIMILRAVPGVQAVLPDSMPSVEVPLKVDDTAGFENGWAVIHDNIGAEAFLITEVNHDSDHITTAAPLSRRYLANSVVFQAQYRHVYLDKETCPDHPRLVMRDWQGHESIVAEDIESIRFSYWLHDDTETTVQPADVTQIDMVRMSIVGRTARADSSLPEDDPYRKRDMSARVQLRNFHLKSGI